MTHQEHDAEGGPGPSILDIAGAVLLVFAAGFVFGLVVGVLL